MDLLLCDFGGQDTEQKSPGQCPGLASFMRLCVLQDRYQILSPVRSSDASLYFAIVFSMISSGRL